VRKEAGNRTRMQITPEIAEKALRAFLDAYHDTAPDQLKETLQHVPDGMHLQAERIREHN
jgi:hypothetical protein